MTRSGFRASTGFITAVVSLATFTDDFVYSAIIPIMPFVLSDRIGIPEEGLQKCVYPLHVSFPSPGAICNNFDVLGTSILIATYAIANVLGSRKSEH